MKIENVVNSFEQTEVKSSKYSRSIYDDAEKLGVRKLSEVLTDSEYQFVIATKSTKKQAKAKLEKEIRGLRCVDYTYLEDLRNAEIKLCYFPVHYIRVDRYKYTVGFESACRSSTKDFGIKGKKAHYSDLFCINAKQNQEYYTLSGNIGDDARKAKYADCDVLGSNDINRVITFAEFKPEEGKEVLSAEYQILQTVYCPIWVVCVQSGGVDRYTYISDCSDTVEMSMAYNQSELEDVARKLRKPRRFFRKLSDVKFYFWSWAVVAVICFFVGMIMNVDKVLAGSSITSIGPFTVSAMACVFLHWAIYFVSTKTIYSSDESNPLIDSLSVGETKAKILKDLFVMSLVVFPIVITAAMVLYFK